MNKDSALAKKLPTLSSNYQNVYSSGSVHCSAGNYIVLYLSISIALLAARAFLKRSRPQQLTVCRSWQAEALQATVSEGLTKGPYVAARAGFIRSTNAPSRPTNHHYETTIKPIITAYYVLRVLLIMTLFSYTNPHSFLLFYILWLLWHLLNFYVVELRFVDQLYFLCRAYIKMPQATNVSGQEMTGTGPAGHFTLTQKELRHTRRNRPDRIYQVKATVNYSPIQQ